MTHSARTSVVDAPRRVPVCGVEVALALDLVPVALALAGADTRPEDVEVHLRCVLQAHAGGEHHGFVMELGGAHGRALWATWTELPPTTVEVRADCQAVSRPERGSQPCCEFADHPGAHTFDTYDPWVAPAIDSALPRRGGKPQSALSVSTHPTDLGEPVHTSPDRVPALAPPNFPDLGAAYVALLRLAMQEHQFRIAPRGNAAREVIGVGFRLLDPRQRLPYLAARQVNPVFHFAEALWYLGGRRDLEMIGHYAPSMVASSRDGVTIDGSAYGYRIFSPPRSTAARRSTA